jgi:hypothetical protein
MSTSLRLPRVPRAADPKRYTATTSGKAENRAPNAESRASGIAALFPRNGIFRAPTITASSYRNPRLPTRNRLETAEQKGRSCELPLNRDRRGVGIDAICVPGLGEFAGTSLFCDFWGFVGEGVALERSAQSLGATESRKGDHPSFAVCFSEDPIPSVGKCRRGTGVRCSEWKC